jgi:hypothetical protein
MTLSHPGINHGGHSDGSLLASTNLHDVLIVGGAKYGTIARPQQKPGAEESLRRVSNEEIAQNIPVFVVQHIYKADEGNDVYYLTIGFTNREAYASNANSPE